jgi:hypothetical protein
MIARSFHLFPLLLCSLGPAVPYPILFSRLRSSFFTFFLFSAPYESRALFIHEPPVSGPATPDPQPTLIPINDNDMVIDVTSLFP